MSGRVVHFEIPFDDGDRARTFYEKAFSWQLQSWGPDYTMVNTGPTGEAGPSEPGYIGGGMAPRDQLTGGSPLVVVDVPDIDAAMARITELGGTSVVDKQPVGDMGFSAYFRDTEGNVIGLWETAGAS